MKNKEYLQNLLKNNINRIERINIEIELVNQEKSILYKQNDVYEHMLDDIKDKKMKNKK